MQGLESSAVCQDVKVTAVGDIQLPAGDPSLCRTVAMTHEICRDLCMDNCKPTCMQGEHLVYGLCVLAAEPAIGHWGQQHSL